MLKRLVFVSGFIPVAVYLMLRWIVTGDDVLEGMDRFEHWLQP